MNKRLGTVPDTVSQWLTPEEFAALSRTEKDIYLYTLFALVVRRPNPQPREQQDASEHN
jgi:hypothetical protein